MSDRPIRMRLADMITGGQVSAELAKTTEALSFAQTEITKLSADNEKKNRVLSTFSPGIPTVDYMPQYTNRSWLAWAYFFEQEVSIYSDIVQKIRDETFRNGVSWEPNFTLRCAACQKEFSKKVDACDRCGSVELNPPDETELEWFKRIDTGTSLLDEANYNRQSFIAICKALELHIGVADNLFLLAMKKYTFRKDGTIEHSVVTDFVALDPRDCVLMYNELGQIGKAGKICLVHREALIGSKDDADLNKKLTRCPECGKPLHEAWYMVQTATAPCRYYTRDEVFHDSYYYPSSLYGYPLALKMQDDLWAYHYIEKRTRAFYEQARAPGIMFIPTTNQDQLISTWLNMVEQIKQDPYTIPVIGTAESAPTQANFIRLLEDPNPNLIAVKAELRERISSRWGVTVTFVNDTGPTADSKNLITVTDRTIGNKQNFYNSRLFKWIARQCHIKEHSLKCNPHVQQNELSKEQLFSMRVQNARGMLEMGYETDYENQQFEFSGTAKDIYALDATGEGGKYDENGNPYKASDDPRDKTAPRRLPEPRPMTPAARSLKPTTARRGRTLKQLHGGPGGGPRV
jgi:hypothetical protein